LARSAAASERRSSFSSALSCGIATKSASRIFPCSNPKVEVTAEMAKARPDPVFKYFSN